MCYSALVQRDLDYLNRRYGVVAVRQDLEDYHKASAADPKRFPPLEDRIFPHHYAPIMEEHDGRRVVELMRYSIYPPFFVHDEKKYAAVFNARRDNLTSAFWSESFMRHHGFIVIKAFYEWVAVADLLQAGVVTLAQVTAEFARQATERQVKVEAAGKTYKPTPTERKDPRFRQIIIEFLPKSDAGDLLVPVVYSVRKLDDGSVGKGFAIVTDDPPPEISIAGHDRCPVFLADLAAVEAWLHPERQSAAEMLAILGRQRRIAFTHALPEAA